MKILQNLEPAGVFRFFEEICSIPHVSFKEKQLSDYCVNFAKERNLSAENSIGKILLKNKFMERIDNETCKNSVS